MDESSFHRRSVPLGRTVNPDGADRTCVYIVNPDFYLTSIVTENILDGMTLGPYGKCDFNARTERENKGRNDRVLGES
jgi:hypothetical protein